MTNVTLPIVWLRHDPFWSCLTLLSQRIGNALLDTGRNDGTWLAISINPPHHSVGHRTREDAERALEGAVLAVGVASDDEADAARFRWLVSAGHEEGEDIRSLIDTARAEIRSRRA